MIVVHVEIWPHGDPDRAQRLATIGVANTTGAGEVADYSVAAIAASGTKSFARVRRHHRRYGWVPLVSRVLEALRKPQADVPQGAEIARALVEARRRSGPRTAA